MNLIKGNFRSIIIVVLIVLGLLVTVYSVKNPQIFKSRADSSRFQVKGSDGSEVLFENDKYTTSSDHITIGIQDQAVDNGLFNRP